MKITYLEIFFLIYNVYLLCNTIAKYLNKQHTK